MNSFINSHDLWCRNDDCSIAGAIFKYCIRPFVYFCLYNVKGAAIATVISSRNSLSALWTLQFLTENKLF